jgi:hypothetical protein
MWMIELTTNTRTAETPMGRSRDVTGTIVYLR